jgi:DNA-binding transcriptional ArsR family regulator
VNGDADIAAVGAALADRRRARILLALGDGRALPASVLAAEAGVAPSTASEHLAKLLDVGMVEAERHGRHRYFRIASPAVGELLEAAAHVAPVEPVRSLRQSTKAGLLRNARTCYDHLAGRLGTALMSSLIARGLLEGGDGTFDPERASRDHLAGPGRDLGYRLTADGVDAMHDFGLDVDEIGGGSRPLIRYCIDWSEQRHHLAGGLGAAMASRMFELDWICRHRLPRVVVVTDEGEQGLADTFGVELPSTA